MTIALAVSGEAFAAFAARLAVWIVNRSIQAATDWYIELRSKTNDGIFFDPV
jgi:hypothetical protein